jgi:hypothetical protein
VTKSELSELWDWWLDCPFWKPFVDYLRRCPILGDPPLLPGEERPKRGPLPGLIVLILFYGSLAWGLIMIVRFLA